MIKNKDKILSTNQKTPRQMERNKKIRPIEVSQKELEILKKRAADLPSLLEYAHSVGGFAIIPTEQGQIKGKAMQAMQEQTQERLDMIMEQMMVLAKQAREIKSRVEVSEEIYNADINFQPVMGKTYYLYQKHNDKNTLSLIGPTEWGNNPKYNFCKAKVQLMADHTWKVLEDFQTKNNKN